MAGRRYASARALTCCPACAYSLSGLPTDHACPECGLRYSSESRTWTEQVGLMRRLVFWLPAVLLAAVVGQWLIRAFRVADFLLFVGGLIVILVYVPKRLRRAGNATLSVLPDGILQSSRGESRLLRWSDVRSQVRHNLMPQVTIVLTVGEERHFLFCKFEEAEAFAECVRRVCSSSGRDTF